VFKTFWKRLRGDAAEAYAARCLRRRGYRILERNLSLGGGEIDLLAREGKSLVVVEVKARSSDAYGSAAEAVTASKAQRLAKAARAVMRSPRYHGEPLRCDLAAVELDASGTPVACEIHANCIDLAGALSGRRWRM
jgi:putative endonuclease